MHFLKKYGMAIFATILILGAVVWIVADKLSTVADAKYYRQWVIDEAALLSEEAEAQIASCNRLLDEKYGSVTGIITVENLHGMEISEEIIRQFREYGFGENDILLMFSRDDGVWYMDYGERMAQYTDNTLRITAIEHVTENIYVSADDDVLTLYSCLLDWYDSSVPEGNGSNYGRHRAPTGTDIIVGFFLLTLGTVLLLLLVRYLFVPLFRYSATRTWQPLWGWHLLGPIHIGKQNKNT